jgi:putative aldouronate transport system substrate-binding protein
MKKVIMVLLVVSLAFPVFATGATETKTTAPVAELKGPGNVTLKRLGYNVGFDVTKDISVRIMKEATGYDVEYFALPADNATEKLLIEVASGKDYDLINMTPDRWRILLSNGALMPLNDLLDKYGKDILAGNPEEVWKALSDEKGNIYGLPYMYPYDTEINNFMIARMDLLRAAGITEVPTTIDAFYDMLVVLKKFYGNKYIILAGPYQAASSGSVGRLTVPGIISSAFGIYNDWMLDSNGKVIYMTEHPRYKEMLAFIAKLGKEGLIDADWAANTTSSVQEKFASGKAIITCAGRPLAQACIPTLKSAYNLKDEDFGFISALEDKNGTCTYMESTAINQVTAILKRSKNAADVINWINLRVQKQLFINIGVEGVHFTYDKDGSINPINPIFSDERGNSYYYLDALDTAAFKNQWPSRIRKSAAQWLAFNAVTIKTNAERPDIFVENPFKFMPASDNFAKYNTTLLNSLNDFMVQVMSGARTAADLDTFMKDWRSNNGEEVKKELQAYLNAN